MSDDAPNAPDGPEVTRDPFGARLAEVVRATRLSNDLSVSALAEKSGVSRAMIVKVERADCQPTVVLLGRLSTALGTTASELIARAEDPAGDSGRLHRAGDQTTWTDPVTGYRRRTLSPVAGGPLQLTEIELPPGASLAYPGDAYASIHQQVWVLAGRLQVSEGPHVHDLAEGDCLELGPAQDCVWTNPGTSGCRYLIAISRRRSSSAAGTPRGVPTPIST